MKAYKIDIKNIFIVTILSSFLSAEMGLTSGLSYGGVTYNEKIFRHMSITNELGFNASFEKSVGPILIGTGYLIQNYTESFNSQYDDSTFKNTVSVSYVMGYLIYPYEVWKFRFWGGFQFGQCLGGDMIKTENGIEIETTMSSDDYNLDLGFLVGTDIMITERIGSRFSYYYGITKVLKENISLNGTNLNVINVGVNAQLLVRF